MIKEKPMLFSGPMVRAILEGRKTQTRRICKEIGPDFPHHALDEVCEKNGRWFVLNQVDVDRTSKWELKIPHPVGSRIWVKETWGPCDGGVCYRASEKPTVKPDGGKWRPSIFMPRWASRITLEVTEVRMEKLQDISEEDAKAEGCSAFDDSGIADADWIGCEDATASTQYAALWESINGSGSWDQNPWVWVYTFRRVI